MDMSNRAGKFQTLAEKRTSDAIKKIRAIGKLSRRQTYEWTPEQVQQIFDALRAEIDHAESNFQPREERTPSSPLFRFQ